MTGNMHSVLPMVMQFDDSLLSTIGNLQSFLDGTLPITFQPLRREERSAWIRHTLLRFHYRNCTRKDKKIVRRYIRKISNLSRSQLTRHIAACRDNRPIGLPYVRRSFPVVYTPEDMVLLAETDNLHLRLNAAATIAIMAEEYARGDRRYERLHRISPSRLYDLRKERRYRERALTYEKTKPVAIPIGERRRPEPDGQPGFLRIDTVHQGDDGKRKGVYHVNFVDEVTQWEVPWATEQIAESCMAIVLQGVLPLFPFGIHNYHSDNGSENINYTVARLLTKLGITQTKSRPRISNDNGLVETKNGAIIRKHMTYYHIPQPYAARINVFYREHLIPYLNFHRPCAFPTVEILPNGKRKVIYRREDYRTPYEKLKSLPDWEQYRCRGITAAMLEEQAHAKSPNQAAREMQEAKRTLFDIILPRYDGIL
jgi:hypothetical protein